MGIEENGEERLLALGLTDNDGELPFVDDTSGSTVAENYDNGDNQNNGLASRRIETDTSQPRGNSSNVMTSRSNRGPPKMAFLRIGQRHSDQVGHAHHSATSSSTSLHDASHRGPDHSQLEDDIMSSLLPPSQSQYPSLSRPLFHPENFVELRQFIRQTMRRGGNYLAYCTLLTMLIVVPLILYRALEDRKVDKAAFNSAWVMVWGTIVLSCRLVYLHLTHWFMPDVQKYVVRILWMVPIYSIQSYLSLRFHHARVYMSTIRDFYEAFVIASFVYYLIELLGGQESLIQLLRCKDPAYGRHSFPFSLILQPWELGVEFMLQCKHGVLQYVVFKTTATIVTFLCESAGVYGEGRFEWFVAYPYLCFFQNISVMYALYCLVTLFHAINEELRHPVNWHPLGKFLCIKGVVFFTWWQGVIFSYLRAHGIIEHMGTWSSIDVANGFIDYCIVVEMVIFAIAHSYTFTYTEYLPGRLPLPSTSTPEESREDVDGVRNVPNEESSSPSQPRQYRPPATLPQPMNFRDALWSSTVPKETLQDIQRLRAGVDGALNSHRSSRVREVSLSEINKSGSEDKEGGMSESLFDQRDKV
jgi:Organic solute transporter Ostalpha